MDSRWSVEPLIEGSALQSTVALARRDGAVVLVDTSYERQEKALLDALARRGLDADAVTLVANTHLHFDHAQNNSLFRKALILCSRSDHQWTLALYDRLLLKQVSIDDIREYYPELEVSADQPDPLRGVVRLLQRFWKSERLGRPDQVRWIEDTPLPAGIHAWPTPGHVPHHYSFVFDTQGGRTLVAGDAVITRGEIDRDVMTFPPAHRVQYEATKRRLLAFEGTILPGHDASFVSRPSA